MELSWILIERQAPDTIRVKISGLGHVTLHSGNIEGSLFLT